MSYRNRASQICRAYNRKIESTDDHPYKSPERLQKMSG